jgi:hypothetical protein
LLEDAAAITQEANSVWVPLQRSLKEDVMKRNLIGTLSLVAMSLLLNINGAYAQSVAKANVPFAFNVGSSQLPAGNYIVKVEGGSGLIMIRNSTTLATVLSLGQYESPGGKSRKLVFQRLGNRYFLTQIWGEQGSTGLMFRAPKPETKPEIASQPSPSRKEVEIALK